MPDLLSPMAEAAPVGGTASAGAQTMFSAALGVLGPFVAGVGIIQSLSARHAIIKKESPILKTYDKDQVAKDRPVPVVYGQKKVAGQIVYREDTLDPQFDMAVGLCEGEVSAVTDVRINGRVAEEIGDTSYTAYLGTADQEADSRFGDGQVSLGCEADAYIDETAKDTAHNTSLLIISDGSWTALTSNLAPGERRVYTRFNLAATNIPAGLNITSAQVRIQKSTIPGGNKRDIKGYGTTGAGAETWDETTLTWNNAPSRGAQYVASTTVSQGGSWVDLVLNAAGIAALKAAYAAGGKISLEIAPDDDEILTFKSKDSEYVAPTLIIHYEGATANAFRNLCYLAVSVDDRAGLAGGNYPSVTAVVEGAKIRVWDGVAFTTEYNNNPAWVIYDILTHARRGLGSILSDSLFNVDTFKDVADYCDELVTRPDGQTEARYRCDAVYDTRIKAFEGIWEVMAAAGIYFYRVDGKTCLGIEKNESVSHAFTMSNIVRDSFSYSVLDRFDVPNIIRASYTDPAEDFKEVYVQSESEADRADYGDKIQDISLFTVNRKWEAVRRAHWLLWRGLLTEYMCKFRVSINNADVAPGDVCSVTHDLPGWSAKQFRIIEVREYSDDEIELVCQQYVAKTAALETNLPNVAYIAPNSGEVPTSEPVPSAPTWTLEPRPGGWLIEVTGPVSGAKQYDVYQLNEDTQLYDILAGSIIDGRSDAAQARSSVSLFIPAQNPTGAREWASFKLRTVILTRQSDLSAAQGNYSEPRMAANTIPQAPTLSTDGYPLITRLGKYNAFTFQIRNLIIAYAAEADFIRQYELRRRDDGGTGQVTWSAWRSLPEKLFINPSTPNPRQVTYDNTDHLFVPGYYYQYRARAIGQNGKAGAWSNTVSILLADDTTAPDAPVFTATELPLMVRLDIQAATQGGGACPDFSHWLIEYSDNSGSSWATLQAEWRDTTYIDVDLPATLETNRMYRITAYDYSGNASTVSTPSTNKKREEIPGSVLAPGAVTPDKANLSLHNWQLTTVWSSTDYNTVAWAAGLLITGDGTQYSIGAGNTGNMTAGYRHYVYFDVAVSTTALQVTTTAADAVGEGKILVGACFPNTDTAKKAEFQMFGGVGASLRIVTTDWLVADCVAANEITVNTLESLTVNTGHLTTASSGARVEILPDSNTGLVIYDNTSPTPNEVFRVNVGGTDVGDVIIGNAAGEYVKWDKSAGTLKLNANQINFGTTYILTDLIYGSYDLNMIGACTIAMGASSQITIDAKKVLGSQGAHIADADGTLADVTSKFNTLLTRLEAGTGHGLLASS